MWLRTPDLDPLSVGELADLMNTLPQHRQLSFIRSLSEPLGQQLTELRMQTLAGRAAAPAEETPAAEPTHSKIRIPGLSRA